MFRVENRPSKPQKKDPKKEVDCFWKHQNKKEAVRDGQTSSHRPRLVVSRSTCPPLPRPLPVLLRPNTTPQWEPDPAPEQHRGARAPGLHARAASNEQTATASTHATHMCATRKRPRTIGGVLLSPDTTHCLISGSKLHFFYQTSVFLFQLPFFNSKLPFFLFQTSVFLFQTSVFLFHGCRRREGHGRPERAPGRHRRSATPTPHRDCGYPQAPLPHTHADAAPRQFTMHNSTNDLHCCKPCLLQWAPSRGRPPRRPPATAGTPRIDLPHQQRQTALEDR